MKDKNLLKLGAKIKYERSIRSFSQEELAEKSNLSVHTISDLERGLTDIRYTNLLQIATAFEIDIIDLLNFRM